MSDALLRGRASRRRSCLRLGECEAQPEFILTIFLVAPKSPARRLWGVQIGKEQRRRITGHLTLLFVASLSFGSERCAPYIISVSVNAGGAGEGSLSCPRSDLPP